MASRKIETALALTLALAINRLGWAQTSSNSIGTTRADIAIVQGPLTITVVAVQGGSQFRLPGEIKWHTLAANATLAEGVEFRTGPKGTIQFTVGTDQVYRVDRLTIVKVLRATLGADGTIKTDVGLQYGRVSKDVDAPARPHEDTIVSPSSTLAVRGTRVSLYDQPPYEPEAVSLTGRAVFNSLGRQLVAFGAKGEGTAVVNSSHPDPASNALSSRLVDPSIAAARTSSEQRLLADLITNGAVLNVNNPLMLPTVSNTGVPTEAQLSNLVDGSLIFITRWNTNTHIQMGLLGTATTMGQADEFIFPALGLNVTSTGGRILFDNLGGPKGGFEIINYPTNAFANGPFDVSAYNAGNQATTVKFDAFIKAPNGQLVRQLFANTDDLFAPPLQTVTQTVAVGRTGGAIAFVTKSDPNFLYNQFTDPGFPITDLSRHRTVKTMAPAPVDSPVVSAPTPARIFISPTKR